MNKRSPVTSPSEAVRLMQGANRDLLPPAHVPLQDQHWPFWRSVIAEFARANWTEHQLELVAMLARAMAMLEAEQTTLEAEGLIVTRQNGSTGENPRLRVVKSLTGDILSLRRSMQLHARGQHGEIQKTGPRNKYARMVEEFDHDDLLARPD